MTSLIVRTDVSQGGALAGASTLLPSALATRLRLPSATSNLPARRFSSKQHDQVDDREDGRKGEGKERMQADVVIIGGGVTGSALLYELAEFTDLSKVILLERRAQFAQVASGPNNNSQTIHCGDIETNYTVDKAASVQRLANMLRNFATKLPEPERSQTIAKMQKMAIGVGDKECEFLTERFGKFKPVYKKLEQLPIEEVAKVEPAVAYANMNTRKFRKENVVASYVKDDHSAVDYFHLTNNMIRMAEEIGKRSPHRTIKALLGTEMVHIEDHTRGLNLGPQMSAGTGKGSPNGDPAAERLEGAAGPGTADTAAGAKGGIHHKSSENSTSSRASGHRYNYTVRTSDGEIDARFVVLASCGYSLLAAHRLGYAKNFSCLPVAGSFYFGPKVLNGKVYCVQNPRLPFAAVHGDPDLVEGGKTRFGPTALPLPLLERYEWRRTFTDFLRVLRPSPALVKVYWDLFKDTTIRNYLFKNVLFEVPVVNRRLFLSDVRKIVPSLQLKDLSYAHGFGGVRPQIIDTVSKKLLLGEGKISPEKAPIIFNVTPSPGGTTCLGNAETDMRKICSFLGCKIDETKFSKIMLNGEYPVESVKQSNLCTP